MKTPRWLWVVIGLSSLMFVMTGVSKLAAIPPSPENFARWGLSPTMMRLIGVLEVLGGIGLLVPLVSRAAALGLIAIMFGALRTGIVFHETLHIALPLVLIAMLAVIALRRRR